MSYIYIYQAVGAQFGEFLGSCRVKILDDDSFPTNKFQSLCKQQEFYEIPTRLQFWEMCKMFMKDFTSNI